MEETGATEEEKLDRDRLKLEIGVRVAKLNSLCSIDFIADVLDLIENTGYTLLNSDAFGISFSIRSAESYFTGKCNRKDVPEPLKTYAMQYATADFLSKKLASGKIEIDGIDLSSVIVTSIEEGDTKTQFDKSGTDRTAFENCINYLKNAAEIDGVIQCYTKVRW